MATLLGSLLVKLGLDMTEFRSGLTASEKELRKAQRSIERAGREMENLGAQMAAVITLPLIAAGAAVAKTAGNFESAMTRIEIATKASKAEMQAMNDLALQIGKDTIFGASQAAGAMETLAKSGIDTKTIIDGAAEAVTLVARMEDSALDPAPIWDDLRSFDGRPWRGRVHLVSAGYPCQPFSIAGLRRGTSDPRHLWPEVARIADEIQPEWVFAENVEGHLSLGLADVARDLEALGYRTKAGVFSAREAGASHRRRRLFILAHADRGRCGLSAGAGDRPGFDRGGQAARHSVDQLRPVLGEQCGAGLDNVVDHAPTTRPRAGGAARPVFAPGPAELQAWRDVLDQEPDLQPAVLRVADGLADRLDRSRAVGNGVCSLAAAVAWTTLKRAHVADLAVRRGQNAE